MVTWFLDDVPYYTVTEEVPDQPMIIVMDLHLSAHWDGPPDASLHLPAILEIELRTSDEYRAALRSQLQTVWAPVERKARGPADSCLWSRDERA